MIDAVPAIECPYKGLEPYTEADSVLFAGREEDVGRVISNLYASSLTILYGASGVGKTSLLWAGVVPELKQDVPDTRKKKRVAVVVFREWQSKDFQRKLRERVLLAVLETINAKLLKPGSVRIDLERLRSALNQTLAEESESGNEDIESARRADLRLPKNIDELPLDGFLIHCAHAIQGRIFFIIDQFEEYFLYHPLSETDNDFDEQLARAVNSSEIPVSFLISLREDGLSKLDRLLGRIPNLLGNMLRVEHLSQAGALAAIKKPLTRTPGVSIEDGLISRLFVELDPDLVGFDDSNRSNSIGPKGKASRVNGAFLQIVLTRLWAKEIGKGSKRLTLETFEALKGANKIASRYFDDVMGLQLRKAVLARNAAATENEICEIRDSAADLFKFLVTVIGSKFAPTVGDLAGLIQRSPDLVFQTLEILKDIRVVRLVDGAANIAARRYEIAHDVLGSAIRRWRERHETDKARREAERKRQEAEQRTQLEEQRRQLAEHAKRLAEEREREAENNKELEKQNRKLAEQAREEAESREAVQTRMVRTLMLLLFVAGATLIWALWESKRERDLASELRNQLSQACWSNFNQADRLIQLGRWSEGILHLALALEFDPNNELAAERFFHELMLNRGQGTRHVPISEFNHQGSVSEAIFDSDGRNILTVSENAAMLWDSSFGKLLRRFPHGGKVWNAAFNSRGTRVLTAGADNTAKLWDSTSGTLLQTLPHQGQVLQVAFDPNGRRVLTASTDGTAVLWDETSGKPLHTFRHDRVVQQAAFSPDGRLILTVSQDYTLKLWNALSCQLVGSFAEGVSAAIFSPDSGRLLTVTQDNAVQLWSLNPFRVLVTFGHAGRVSSAVFSRDGQRVLTASSDKSATVWDAMTGKLLSSFQDTGTISTAIFSPDRKRIVTASSDNFVKLWDAASGRLLGYFPHAGSVSAAVFSPEGGRILTASADNTARLWDVTSHDFRPCIRHAHLVSAICSPANNRIVTTSSDGSAKLWNATNGVLLQTFKHEAEVLQATTDHEGARILTVSRDKFARLWDATSGNLLKYFEHGPAVREAVFSPNGSSVLTLGGDNMAKLWDATSGDLLRSFKHDREVWAAVFSPDSKRILTASADSTAKLWDATSGELLRTFKHERDVLCAAFDPKGRWILTASADGTAKLWDANTGEQFKNLPHDAYVSQADFSSDGSFVLTVSGLDHTPKLWEAATGKALPSFAGETSASTAVFSPNAELILTASRDGTAKLWQIKNGGDVVVRLLASFQEDAFVSAAVFSGDGRRILTVSGDKAEMWDVNSPKLIVAQLRSGSHDLTDEAGRLSKYVTRASMSKEGTRTEMSDDDWSKGLDHLRGDATSGNPDDVNARFIGWFLGIETKPRVFPDNGESMDEWKKNTVPER